MNYATIAFATLFAITSSLALAQTTKPKPAMKTTNNVGAKDRLRSNNGNPNGNPDGPTTLSGTGNSSYGGSSPGTSGRN